MAPYAKADKPGKKKIAFGAVFLADASAPVLVCGMRLKKFLTQNDHKQSKVAELLGIDTGLLSRHANGDIMPSPDNCEKYKEWSGGEVTANDFHDHFIERQGERNGSGNNSHNKR